MRTCSNEGPRHFPRGDNYEIAKIYWRNLKIFFSRSTGTISTILSTMHPWVKEIQDCSNAKIHWRNLKIFFSKTTGPITTKLSTMHPWLKRIQDCSKEEPFNSHKVSNVFSSLNDNHMRELIWTIFSSERCGPWPSYFLFSLYLKICALSKYKQGTQQ